MLALIQRVTSASVQINAKKAGQIEKGLLVFLGIEKDDGEADADKLLNKVLAYRIFSDAKDKMNLCVSDVRGGVLIIPQFTLVADTKSGLRPNYSSAKPPQEAERLYQYFLDQAHNQNDQIASGSFGVDMQVSLVNDGPVTFLLKS